NHSHQGIIVRDEDLQVVTGLRQLRWGTDKVGDWLRSPVPDKHRQSLVPQMIGNATADDPEANDPNRLSDGPRHIPTIWKLRLNPRPRNCSLHHKMDRTRPAPTSTRPRRRDASLREGVP